MGNINSQADPQTMRTFDNVILKIRTLYFGFYVVVHSGALGLYNGIPRGWNKQDEFKTVTWVLGVRVVGFGVFGPGLNEKILSV